LWIAQKYAQNVGANLSWKGEIVAEKKSDLRKAGSRYFGLRMPQPVCPYTSFITRWLSDSVLKRENKKCWTAAEITQRQNIDTSNLNKTQIGSFGQIQVVNGKNYSFGL
jgi:hypothetical protein